MYGTVVVVQIEGAPMDAALAQIRNVVHQRLGKRVVLAGVTEPIQPVAIDYVLDPWVLARAEEDGRERMQKSLEAIAGTIDWGGVSHEIRVESGFESIVVPAIASDVGADLVVLNNPSACGRRSSARTRRLYKTLRSLCLPVLVAPEARLQPAPSMGTVGI